MSNVWREDPSEEEGCKRDERDEGEADAGQREKTDDGKAFFFIRPHVLSPWDRVSARAS